MFFNALPTIVPETFTYEIADAVYESTTAVRSVASGCFTEALSSTEYSSTINEGKPLNTATLPLR